MNRSNNTLAASCSGNHIDSVAGPGAFIDPNYIADWAMVEALDAQPKTELFPLDGTLPAKSVWPLEPEARPAQSRELILATARLWVGESEDSSGQLQQPQDPELRAAMTELQAQLKGERTAAAGANGGNRPPMIAAVGASGDQPEYRRRRELMRSQLAFRPLVVAMMLAIAAPVTVIAAVVLTFAR